MSGASSAAAKGSTAASIRPVTTSSLLRRFGCGCGGMALSFGGPAGQFATMHRILLEEKRWIGEAVPGRTRLWSKTDSAVHGADIVMRPLR